MGAEFHSLTPRVLQLRLYGYDSVAAKNGRKANSRSVFFFSLGLLHTCPFQGTAPHTAEDPMCPALQ